MTITGKSFPTGAQVVYTVGESNDNNEYDCVTQTNSASEITCLTQGFADESKLAVFKLKSGSSFTALGVNDTTTYNGTAAATPVVS